MSMTVDTTRDRSVLIVASNPATSTQTGWPIGFWWSELTHPYWTLTEAGYHVDVASPDGGALIGDAYSDPTDPSGYSADDLLSLGFMTSPVSRALTEQSTPLASVDPTDYDAVLVIGGQGPMITFYNDERVHQLVASNYEAGRITAAICHGTCVLLKARKADGTLVVDGKTWTGFANSEEDYADQAAGVKIQPFRIEDQARALPNTNFVVQGRFRAHAIRDGNLITGQQQYSGAAAARLIIEAVGR
ncbi:MAG: type 1 glutamine amidotransferase domain-containing protein [Kineosporiaceae bacterium]